MNLTAPSSLVSHLLSPKVTAVALAMITASFTLFATTASGQTVKEIVTALEKQKIETLNKYLADNPEAVDASAAYGQLIGAHLFLGQDELASPLHKKMYDMMPKGEKAEVDGLMQVAAIPYFDSLKDLGKKDEAKAFFKQVKADLKGHEMADAVSRYIDNAVEQLDAPGKGDAVTLAGKTIAGEDFDINKMEGKVILIDFWATWCGPCLAELPSLKKAYAAHKEQGFEIIGVSLDKKMDTLNTFLEKEGLDWPQICSGKGWEDAMAKQFKVQGIPATFLVKDGVIVATNLRGPALEEAIKNNLN